MSSFLQKHTFVYAATFSLAFTQFACSKTEKTETTTSTTTTATTKEQAYDDYKSYVTTLESDVERGWDSTAADADARMAQWRNDYEAKRTALAQYEADLDETQRQEYDALQSRYNTAWATREEQYNTWRMNHQGTGMAATGTTGTVDMTLYNESKIPSYTATDIRSAYEDFVKHVQANKAGFSNEDWRTVEKYWNQLDDRKNAIQSQLTDKDKWEIAKAKTQYITIKNTSKAGNTASNVGSDVKEVGKDISNSKAGEATKDAGKAVGNTAKKAGQKVGEVFKDDN